jgi:hypothetical protein
MSVSEGGRRRPVVTGVLVLVVLAAGAGVAWRAGTFGSHGSSGTGHGAPPPATQQVVRESLSSTTPVTATLGYADSYTVTGKGAGTLTSLPSAGQVIRQGQVLYRVDNGSPAVLLYGAVPAWRTLEEGLSGADVTQLNHDLVALGYADSSDISTLGWDYFSWETAYGAQRMESALGVSSPPGRISSVGTVASGPAGSATVQVTVALTRPSAAGTLDQAPVTVYITTAVDNLLASQATPENPAEVTVSQPSDTLTAQADAAGAFNTLFLGLGAVALLVGAVGVANIMIISVLERRQEIGLRRALDATRGQIRVQFLAEAILLPAIRAARLSPTQALWSL